CSNAGSLSRITIPFLAVLASQGATQLQRTVGDAETHRRALQVARVLRDGNADGGLLGGPSDLLEAHAHRHGEPDAGLERHIAPTLLADGSGRTIPRWNDPRRALAGG